MTFFCLFVNVKSIATPNKNETIKTNNYYQTKVGDNDGLLYNDCRTKCSSATGVWKAICLSKCSNLKRSSVAQRSDCRSCRRFAQGSLKFKTCVRANCGGKVGCASCKRLKNANSRKRCIANLC